MYIIISYIFFYYFTLNKIFCCNYILIYFNDVKKIPTTKIKRLLNYFGQLYRGQKSSGSVKPIPLHCSIAPFRFTYK